MKVKWRSQEHLLAGFMAVLTALVSISRVWYGANTNEWPVHALLTVVNVLVIYLAYLWLNRLIIPMAMKTVRSQKPLTAVGLAMGVIGQIIVLAYLLGPGVNFASFYWAPGFSDFQNFPLTLGYHPQPVYNLLGGMNMGFFMIVLFLAYALFRESSLLLIERANERRDYRVLISNQVTTFMLLVIAAPLVFFLFGTIKDNSYYRYYFALIPPAGLLVLSNFYWLFPAYEGRSKREFGFVGKLVLSAGAYVLLFSIFLAENWSAATALAAWLVSLLVFAPVSWLAYQSQRERILHLRGVEKALSRSKADLQLLRSQINPHFLFNALNTLYAKALIEKAPGTASGIQQLGDMMRFMLHDNQRDLIPMSRELEYLANYIALQKLRTQSSPDILIEDNIAGQQCGQQIAPMLLIPFVENAFKYGISLNEPSWIKIRLNCETAAIRFEVRNSVHAKLTGDPENSHSGIGLENVRARLEHQYPGQYDFSYGISGNEFVCTLVLKTK